MSRYVSDAVVDVLADLGCRYLPLNPGSSFRGLHDSVVNHAGNRSPEIILCTHEEIAVAAAHAYAKASGEVGFAAVHNLVGLMHASMAVYDAWCDRTPLVVLGGGGPADPRSRRPIDWFHSAATQVELVRPYVKWDAEPVSAQATLDAIRRAHWVAASAPTGPTYVTIDAAVQEDVAEGLEVAAGATAPPVRMAPHPDDLDAAVAALCGAEFPVIVAGGIGLDPAASAPLVDLMEALGAAGRDERNLTAVPTDHSLCFSGDDSVLADADVLLVVDVHDVRWLLDRAGATPAVIDLSARSLAVGSWSNADHVAAPRTVHLVSDPLLGLRELTTRVQAAAEMDDGFGGRRAGRLADLSDRRRALDERRKDAVARRWDDRPISVPRMVAEVYAAVEGLPWLLTLRNTRSWPEGVWRFDRSGRFLGHSGGGGMGYGPGALIGGGLAARDRGEFAVGIIGDGDLLFAPGAIWTAAHHRIPMLIVVNNNRSYLNDEHHQAEVARMRGRPVDRSHIGTVVTDPDVDFASLGRSLGAWAEGPIEDPADLGPSLARAVEVVKEGGVAVIDVRTGK